MRLKKATALAMASVMALSLTACGGGEKAETTAAGGTETTKAAEETKAEEKKEETEAAEAPEDNGGGCGSSRVPCRVKRRRAMYHPLCMVGRPDQT